MPMAVKAAAKAAAVKTTGMKAAETTSVKPTEPTTTVEAATPAMRRQGGTRLGKCDCARQGDGQENAPRCADTDHTHVDQLLV
jgi:hypothetical protein